MTSPESDPASAHGSRAHATDRPAGRISRATSSVSGSRETWRDLDQSFAIVGELLAGLFVWGGIGWLVGTRVGGHPWPFVVGSLLGFGAGMYLVWLRAEGRIGRRRGRRSGGVNRHRSESEDAGESTEPGEESQR